MYSTFNPIAISERFWGAVRYPRRQLTTMAILGFIDYEAMGRSGGVASTTAVIALIAVCITTVALMAISAWWVYVILCVLDPILLPLKLVLRWVGRKSHDFLADHPWLLLGSGLLLGSIGSFWSVFHFGYSNPVAANAVFWLGIAMFVGAVYRPVVRLNTLGLSSLKND